MNGLPCEQEAEDCVFSDWQEVAEGVRSLGGYWSNEGADHIIGQAQLITELRAALAAVKKENP